MIVITVASTKISEPCFQYVAVGHVHFLDRLDIDGHCLENQVDTGAFRKSQ